jgi:MFS family permease
MTRVAALEHILQEIGNEVRSRREPEHAFTAAAVGALGAIAAGTAAVATVPGLAAAPAWRHPAVVGAVACVLIAIAILFKIERENRVYRAARAEQVSLYAKFAAECGLKNFELPKGLQSAAIVGKGHWFSAAIVLVAALGSASFCLAVWQSARVGPLTHTQSGTQIPSPSYAAGIASDSAASAPSPSSAQVKSSAPEALKK